MRYYENKFSVHLKSFDYLRHLHSELGADSVIVTTHRLDSPFDEMKFTVGNIEYVALDYPEVTL